MFKRCLPSTTLALVLLAACDITSPKSRSGTQFEVCFAPTWIAIKNTGAEWELLDDLPSSASNGPFKIQADVTPLTTVAIGSGSTQTQIYQLSREELASLRCEFNLSFVGSTRTLSNSITGVEASDGVIVNFGGTSTFRSGPGPYELTTRDTTASIIASRRAVGVARTSGTILVRQFRTNGVTSLPLLDFGSAGVRTLDSAALTLANGTPQVSRSTAFISGGTRHTLDAGATASSYYVLTGDKQPGEVYALNLSSGNKSISTYYSGLSGTLSLDFGPDLTAIGASTASTTPCRRDRAELSVQGGLTAGARFTFFVGLGSRSSASAAILVTEAFRDGADKWVAEIPDIPIPSGQCVLPSGGSNRSITATGYGGNIRLALFAPPANGDFLRSVMLTRPAP